MLNACTLSIAVLLLTCDALGVRPPMVCALSLEAAGLGWLAAIAAPDVPYGSLVAPLILIGLGSGAFRPDLPRRPRRRAPRLLMVPRCKRAPEPPAMPHALPESAR